MPRPYYIFASSVVRARRCVPFISPHLSFPHALIGNPCVYYFLQYYVAATFRSPQRKIWKAKTLRYFRIKGMISRKVSLFLFHKEESVFLTISQDAPGFLNSFL